MQEESGSLPNSQRVSNKQSQLRKDKSQFKPKTERQILYSMRRHMVN